MKTLCTSVSVSICVLGLSTSLVACNRSKPPEDTHASIVPASAPSSSPMGGVMQKAGLWEMTTNMSQLPAPIVTKMCVDKGLSGRLAEMSLDAKNKGEMACSKRDVVRSGNTVDIDAICTHDKTTVHSKIHMVMVSDTAYHQTIDATYEPEIAGRNALNTTIDGKWLGDCPDGMKAGDMAMSGGINVNMYEAIKKAKAMKAH